MSYDLPYIPLDLQREILLRMPVEAILRFRSVCKEWCSIIDDPSFVKTHTNNQCSPDADTLLIQSHGDDTQFSFHWSSIRYADGPQAIEALPIRPATDPAYPSALTIACCNGLMLVTFWGINWAIWNPLTQDAHEVLLPRDGLGYRGLGFGYDSAADDYKIVRVAKLETQGGEYLRKTLVYSLKSSCWRVIESNFPCRRPVSSEVGVFLNGALHWAESNGIVALDLATEEYRQLPRPPYGYSTSTAIPCKDMYLNALGGYLALTYYYDDDQGLVVWVMKDYYGVEKAWTKLYSLGEHRRMLGQMWVPSSLTPIFYWERKKQLLLEGKDRFIWLDLTTKNASAKKVTIIFGVLGYSCFSCQPWVKTLFRPGRSVGGSESTASTSPAQAKECLQIEVGE